MCVDLDGRVITAEGRPGRKLSITVPVNANGRRAPIDMTDSVHRLPGMERAFEPPRPRLAGCPHFGRIETDDWHGLVESSSDYYGLSGTRLRHVEEPQQLVPHIRDVEHMLSARERDIQQPHLVLIQRQPTIDHVEAEVVHDPHALPLQSLRAMNAGDDIVGLALGRLTLSERP